MANNESQNNEQTVETNVVRVKLPTFWANNPITWFIQAEAQFTLAKITVESSKYYHVISTLPQDVAESVSDLLQNPPTQNMYKKLKETLIERHSLSVEARIKKLISGEEIGDRKPSDYFRTLQRLAGGNASVGTDLLKKLWLGRLPNVISVALIPHKEEDEDKILKVADQIWEAMQDSNVSTITRNQTSLQQQVVSQISNDELAQLRSEINELKKVVQSRSWDSDRSRDRFKDRNRSVSRNRSNSRKTYNPKGPMCWYHFKFGSRATKCSQPCSYKVPFHQNMSKNNEANSKN